MPRNCKTKLSAEQLLETALGQRAKSARLEVALLEKIAESPGINSQELAVYFRQTEDKIKLILKPYVEDGIVKRSHYRTRTLPISYKMSE